MIIRRLKLRPENESAVWYIKKITREKLLKIHTPSANCGKKKRGGRHCNRIVLPMEFGRNRVENERELRWSIHWHGANDSDSNS